MTFRFTRHTNDLERLSAFYIKILGMEILGGFQNHTDYDGLFIGKTNENWHLEFTKSNEIVQFNFGDEDVLVFYRNTRLEYESILDQINKYSIIIIEAKNPYWNENGKKVLDPDGYRIVISDLKIKL
ncbi:VOC family protein [Flavobacterium sp.]|uniref:VOC family protein n=1 Tax=Flavobacterium sp. TaxID=239 RepID=UPI0037BE50E5